ncbi:MAG: hypothetical protein ACYT04_71030, partial [Nostoc sp.]
MKSTKAEAEKLVEEITFSLTPPKPFSSSFGGGAFVEAGLLEDGSSCFVWSICRLVSPKIEPDGTT